MRSQTLLVVVALGLPCLAVTLFWYTVHIPSARADSCLSNLKSLSFCTMTYASDWDGQFPPRPKSLVIHTLDEGRGARPDLARYLPPDDWRRRIRYINDNAFFCPSTRSLYSYEFNSNLYGAQSDSIRKPAYTPLEYDSGFPTGSPPGPHRRGYNITYCDGHGSWMPVAYRHGASPGLTLTGR
ncbi:MAG: hypothetical protein ACYC63_09185 [Armatimonadota bacterium]